MTYADIVARLSLAKVCLDGGCGLTDNAHRGTIDGFGIVHFAERRVSKRGLRRLFLLCAKRDRLRLNYDGQWITRGFLNDPALWWAAMYLDERKANEWAAQIGVRFPIAYSAPERRSVALVPGLSRRMPAVYAWAHRG